MSHNAVQSLKNIHCFCVIFGEAVILFSLFFIYSEQFQQLTIEPSGSHVWNVIGKRSALCAGKYTYKMMYSTRRAIDKHLIFKLLLVYNNHLTRSFIEKYEYT